MDPPLVYYAFAILCDCLLVEWQKCLICINFLSLILISIQSSDVLGIVLFLRCFFCFLMTCSCNEAYANRMPPCFAPCLWFGRERTNTPAKNLQHAQCNQTNQSNPKHPKHSKIYGNLSNHIGFLKCAKPSLLCTSQASVTMEGVQEIHSLAKYPEPPFSPGSFLGLRLLLLFALHSHCFVMSKMFGW